EIVRDASKGATELHLRHTTGIQNGSVITLFVAGVSDVSLTIASYDAVKNLVVVTVPLDKDVVSGRDFVQIIPRTAAPVPPPDVSLTVSAKASGDWGGNEIEDNGITAGNGVRVSLRPSIGAVLKLLASPTKGGAAASTSTAAQVAGGVSDIPWKSAGGF